jgi:hypothetical protein
MGYLGYFYIESKSFELQSGVGNGGFRLAKWSRGLFRSVVMGFQSVVWMLNMMEQLTNGLTSKEFCRPRRVGDSVFIMQKRQNHYGQFLEITEYGKGGRRSYILIPEGRESYGWGRCILQLRRFVKHFAPAGIAGQQSSWRPRVDGLSFRSIDADESIWLEREFEEKVWDVVRVMDRDKAPGPDGFTMAFFQKCWEILKNDLMAIFAEFHNRGQFEKSLNATFVSLIPKKTCAMDVKDLRPISLVRGDV